MKDDRLNLYKSLFKGREDVFALRWEEGSKSNYIPAYCFDPHRYRLHQIKGGTFQTFTEKTYQPLTDGSLIKHLKGEQVIGLYPYCKITHHGSLLPILMKRIGLKNAEHLLT